MTHANRTDNIEHASSLDNFAAEPRWVAWREEKRKRRDDKPTKPKSPTIRTTTGTHEYRLTVDLGHAKTSRAGLAQIS